MQKEGAEGPIVEVQSIICLGQARVIEESVEAWKVEAECADAVRDLEDVLVVALGLADLIILVQGREWERLLGRQIADPQAAGEKLKAVYEAAEKAFAMLGAGVAAAQKGGFAVERADLFAAARRKLEGLRARFEVEWPAFNRAELEAARERMDRGEFVTMGELLREMDSPD